MASHWTCSAGLLMLNAILFLLICTDHSLLTNAVTPPPYGQLAVDGKFLIQKSTKQIVALHGVSMYWSQWVPRFWVTETVNKIKCACNGNVVRAAMGTQKSFDGYVNNPSREYDRMKTIIEASLDQGIYVVVDWHTGDDLATEEIDYAKDFFTKIARDYGSKYPHILYEIWNEPLRYVTWDAVVKPYSKTMIDLIRTYDKNNVIIVGTPNWDTDVDIVAKSPLTEYPNIAYTLHFYANEYNDDLRAKTQTAYNLGLPMFVTEYGSYSQDGNETRNFQELYKWWYLLDTQKMSYTNWHMADIGEQSSMLVKGTEISNICNPAYLTAYGKIIYYKLKSQDNGVKCDGSGVGGDAGGASARVGIEATQTWNGGGNVAFAITNSGSKAFCSVTFSLSFPQGTSGGVSWNMKDNGNNQFTASSRIESGQTAKFAGMTLNGSGMPTATVLSANAC